MKILAYGDAGAHTGFEKVIRNVMSHLHKTDDFEVVQYGLGYRGNPEIEYPYMVYPAEYNGDWYGMMGMEAAVNKHKPDAIFVLQDLWNITSYMSYKPLEVPAVCYFPVDTPNMKWSYAVSAGAMAEGVTYTNFGAMEVAAAVRDTVDLLVEGASSQDISLDEQRTYVSLPHPEGPKLQLRMDRLSRAQNLSGWNVIPHGLDHSKFGVLDRAAVRKEYGIKEDEFVVGAINTNQFRKRQDTLMRMFAVLAAKKPKARLLLYCTGSDERGWDLQQLARYLGIYDKTYFVHEQIDRPLTESEMCEIYNICDVMINTAGGEGWSLTSMEGAACGVPQLVPDWSATRELWANHGVLLKASDWRFEPKYLNTAHAILDVKAGAMELIALCENEDYRQSMSTKARLLAKSQPSWTDVGRMFERVFYKAIKESRALPETRCLNDLLKERAGHVQSELSRAVYMESGQIVKI